MPGEQLLLINPRRKPRKNPKSRTRRRRVKNTRRRRRHAAGGIRIRRRRVKNPRSHRRRRKNPRMRHHRRRHRNPISVSSITAEFGPALYGAAGGVILDIGYTAIAPSLPTSLTSFSVYAPNIIKIAGAFGIGMAARKFLGNEKGNAVLAGALAIQLYNLAASVLGGTSGLAGLGAYIKSGVGGLGSPNPAVYLQKPMGRMGRVGRVGAYMNTGMSGLGGLGGVGAMAGTYSDDMFS